MKSVEGLGKNIEQAIENALFELKATREDVDIKIISEGGLFRKAKVLVSISEDAIEKYEQKAEKRKKIMEDEDGLLIKKNPTTGETVSKEENKTEKEAKKEVKKAEKEAKKEEKDEAKEEKKERKEKKIIDPETFLNGFISVYNKECSLEKEENEESITYSIKGENVGDLIGYRGESLFALSYLTSVIAGKTEKRILVDIEGYRQKRKESLENLARRTAEKVAKTGRYAKLEPMDPAERRIIHLALQDNDKVTTLSKGTEPHRFIIVFPREYNDKR